MSGLVRSKLGWTNQQVKGSEGVQLPNTTFIHRCLVVQWGYSNHMSPLMQNFHLVKGWAREQLSGFNDESPKSFIMLLGGSVEQGHMIFAEAHTPRLKMCWYGRILLSYFRTWLLWSAPLITPDWKIIYKELFSTMHYVNHKPDMRNGVTPRFQVCSVH